MTAPAEAAARFGAACALGAVLGLLYGFLRPLRPGKTALADSLFVAAMLYCWLVLCFGICRGDIRMGYVLGLFCGAWLWEATVGRLLRPLFFLFWRGASAVWGMVVFPWKKFF